MTETRADLDDLNLSTKTYNALRRNKVHSCAQLLRMGRAEVSRLRWIGPTAIHEIASGLATTQAMEWTEEGAPPQPLGSPSRTVNWRDLCAKLLKGLDENRHEEVRYPGHLRVIMDQARTALQCQSEQGAPPLPELPSAAAQMVEVLGLDDSLVVRQGLARVLRAALALDDLGHRFVAADLEHGAS